MAGRGSWSGSATVVVRAEGANETPTSAAARAAETLAGIKGVAEAQALPREKSRHRPAGPVDRPARP
jgi:hypothetical protein